MTTAAADDRAERLMREPTLGGHARRPWLGEPVRAGLGREGGEAGDGPLRVDQGQHRLLVGVRVGRRGAGRRGRSGCGRRGRRYSWPSRRLWASMSPWLTWPAMGAGTSPSRSLTGRRRRSRGSATRGPDPDPTAARPEGSSPPRRSADPRPRSRETRARGTPPSRWRAPSRPERPPRVEPQSATWATNLPHIPERPVTWPGAQHPAGRRRLYPSAPHLLLSASLTAAPTTSGGCRRSGDREPRP